MEGVVSCRGLRTAVTQEIYSPNFPRCSPGTSSRPRYTSAASERTDARPGLFHDGALRSACDRRCRGVSGPKGMPGVLGRVLAKVWQIQLV
jgi:hypothetical protein